MKEIILVKSGEIALKGLNRATFEDVLRSNIRRQLKDLGRVQVLKAQSTFYVVPEGEDFPMDRGVERIAQVFGIAGFSRALEMPKDMDVISAQSPGYLSGILKKAKTFKVEAKRADKTFPLTSPQICSILGGALLEAMPHLRVDVNHPDVVVMVEIRDFAAYVHGGQQRGAGGMPVGTAGRAAVLISGGIDSPVAAYMMAKRGISLYAVHFASPPYTSRRAELKVLDLLKQVSSYAGRIKYIRVPFTKIQTQISEHCKEDYYTIIMRRFMMRISERIAEETGCEALITGESLGQVASQTMRALAATDGAVNMPVFRPLIGMDKEEIIGVSRKIGTFETSILPYDDCCTVFTPKHPKTKPRLELVENEEQALQIDSLIEEAITGGTVMNIRPFGGKEPDAYPFRRKADSLQQQTVTQK